MANENVENALAAVEALREKRETECERINQQHYLATLATVTLLRALLIEVAALREDLAKRPA